MSELASNILFQLSNFYSYEKQLFSSVVESKFEVSGVEVRKAINELIDAGYFIGSGSMGYWLVENREQAEEAINEIYSREVKLRDRRIKLEKLKGIKFGYTNQTELF